MRTQPRDAADVLAVTKFASPELPGAMVTRVRLEEQLQAAVLSHPVTLVSAPAGYGKSTLIASLARLQPTAWLSLDPDDNDLTRFLQGVAAALQRLNPGVGGELSPAAGYRRMVDGLVNQVLSLLPDRFLLVLDDLQTVTEPAVYRTLEYLIDRMPPPMRLVIGSRQDPPLPLAKLAARGQLAELRRPGLSFTSEEVDRLLQARRLSVSPAELALLQQRTEGWPAGLVLLAGSLERLATPSERSAFLQNMAQTDRYLFDFLAHEVLDQQEEGLRRFLLETAVLPELTPRLCRAVTGVDEPELMLEQLDRRNLVAATHGGLAYRYHALLSAFLQRQLRREQPGAWTELHRRAAAAHTEIGPRMSHYLAGQLWEEAATTAGVIRSRRWSRWATPSGSAFSSPPCGFACGRSGRWPWSTG